MSWVGELSDFGPAPLAVEVYWESYPGKKAHIWRLWQQSGWLQVARVSLETPVSSNEEIITYFCDDMGHPIPAWLGNRLFNMRSSVPSYMHHEPPEELEGQADALYWDFLGRCDQKNLVELEQGEERLFEAIHEVESKALSGVSQIDEYISSLRREKRHPDCSPDRKLSIDSRVAEVEKFKPQLLAVLPDEIQALRENHISVEQDTFESVTYHGRVEILYTVRWTMCSRHQPAPVNISLWTEERFMGNLNVGTKWKAQLGTEYDDHVSRPPSTPGAHKSFIKKKSLYHTVKKTANNATLNKLEDESSKTVGPPIAIEKAPLRQQVSDVLSKHGRLSELKYVRAFLRGKTGTDLKTALIHLAKQDFMGTDDAVYLFKVFSALNSKTSN